MKARPRIRPAEMLAMAAHLVIPEDDAGEISFNAFSLPPYRWRG